MIHELCEQIVEQLTSIGYPISEYLLPGLSEAEIQRVEAKLPFMFPHSLIDMYKWHNGTPIVGGDVAAGRWFFPGWSFDTLDESSTRYTVLSTPTECEVVLWRANWFPVFSGSDISSYGICCDKIRREDGEMVHLEYTAGIATPVEYVSLEALLKTLLAAYKERVIFIGIDGELDYDRGAYSEIWKQVNPGLTRFFE